MQTIKTTTTTTAMGGGTILQAQGTHNSGGQVVYLFPNTTTTAATATTATTTNTNNINNNTSWPKKEPIYGKKQHSGSVGGGGGGGGAGGRVGNDCMHMKVALPSFWPALLANMGICALLIGYIFIGSFLFMSIENDESDGKVRQGESQFSWHTVTSNLYEQQQQQQQQQEHYAHTISNRTVNDVVALNTATSATTSTTTKTTTTTTINEETIRMQHLLNIDHELQNTLYSNDGDAAAAAAAAVVMAEADERQRTVENIWEITVSLNILYKENWTRLAALELARFQNHLIKRLALDMANNAHTRNPPSGMKSTKAYYEQHSTLNTRQVEWRFSTAFLYSLTLISTVGYGTLTPHTSLGRAVTIAYGTFGIPLMLIYLSSVGSILGKLMRFWCTGLFCCCRFKKKRDMKKTNEFQMKQPPAYCYVDISPEATMGPSYDSLSIGTHDSRHTNAFGWSLIFPVLVCLILWLFYIIVGSVVISLLEQWPLIDGIYFCFMSLTTIGFCDLLPGLGGKSSISNGVLYPSSSSNIAVWFCALYILVGLTLISICVNMLHEEIIWRMQIVVKMNTLPHGKTLKKTKNTFYGHAVGVGGGVGGLT